jgi:hypothetical protein
MFVYALIDPSKDTIEYVGKTIRPMARRMAGHRVAAQKSSNRLYAWWKSLGKCGLEPKMELIDDTSTSHEELGDLEKFYIASFRAAGAVLKNTSAGGEGSPGFVFTEKDKAKLKGRVVSEETRARISAGLKGRKPTAGCFKRGATSAYKGYTHNDKQLARDRERMLGNTIRRGSTFSEKSKIKLSRSRGGRPIVDSLGRRYETLSELVQKMGAPGSRTYIRKMLQGSGKIYKGLTFKYAE